jgi:transcriptional regulator with XRE-family HTH domain
MSFQISIPRHRLIGAQALLETRDALIEALFHEKKRRKFSQSELAKALGVDRSVVHRQLKGNGDIGIAKAAEIADMLEHDLIIDIVARHNIGANNASVSPTQKSKVPTVANSATTRNLSGFPNPNTTRPTVKTP